MDDLANRGAAALPQTAATPRITAIIPAYNEADNVARAIASVRSQTFQDWELVVVDDGSKDDTCARAEAAAAGDPRIRVLRKPNGGLSSARNYGVEVARGEWLMFHDADDWIHPRHFETLLEVAEASPEAGLVAGNCAGVGEDGAVQQIYYMMDLADPFPIFARTCAFSVHCILVKRTLVAAAGGFDETLRACEDWDLWQRLARQGVRFAQTADVIAYYRRRPGSMSRDARRMMEAIATVIRRAYGPDPRVSTSGPYANGKPHDDLNDALLTAVVYNAGVGIGAGQDVESLWDFAPDLSRAPLDGRMIGALLVQGIDFGLAMSASELAAQWDTFRPRIEAFLNALSARTGAARQAEVARAYAEALVLGAKAFPGGWRGDHVCALAFDVERDLGELTPADRPLVVAALHHKGHFLSAFEFPEAVLKDPLARGAAMGLAVRSWPTMRGLKEAGAYLRLGFWMRFAGELLAPRRRAQRSNRPLRARLRDVKSRLGSAARRAHERVYDRRPRARVEGVSSGAPYAAVLHYAKVLNDASQPGVTCETVKAHLDLLHQEGLACVSDLAWIEAQEAGLAPAARTAVLTFDGAGVAPDSPVFDELAKRNLPGLVLISVTDGQPSHGWTWQEARRLRQAGMRFGFRPQEGVALSRLPLEELDRQARTLAHIFARELNIMRPAILFPAGDSERTVMLIFLAAGFGFGLWQSPGLAHIDGDGLLQPCIALTGRENIAELARRLAPAYV